MSPYADPDRPPWADRLLAEVAEAFVTTGADTPGWAAPHRTGGPAEEEYSRCLDPGKYRILDSRVDAWARVLADRGVARVEDLDPGGPAWIGALRGPEDLLRVQRVRPVCSDGLSLLLATTLVDGEPFGFDVGLIGPSAPPVLVSSLPYCGCDACDDGSAMLLENLDGWFLVTAAGGVVHARGHGRSRTRTPDGWDGTGGDHDPGWPAEEGPARPSVRRWIGAPWL